MKDLWKDIAFCSTCNYAIAKVRINQARFDYDCPNCGECRISMFYSYGSKTHQINADYGLPKHHRHIEPLPYKELNAK